MHDIPKGWMRIALADLVESAIDGPFGSNLKSEHYVNEPGVRVVRLQNIGSGSFDDSDRAYVSERHARALSRHEVGGGDLLIASLGDENHPVARACIYPPHLPLGIVKADCFRIRVKDDLALASFLQSTLNSNSGRVGLAGRFQGVTRDRINLSSLLSWKVIVPPLETQRRIADILDTLDSQIAYTESVIRKNVTIRLGLAHDLIPVSSDPLLLGDEWELVPLAEVVPSADYGISTALEGDETGTPTLRMNNLSGGRIRLHEVKYSPTSVPGHLILRDRDVLFNRTNSIDHVGRTSIWRNEISRPTTFASYLVRLNPNLDRLRPEYLMRWLNQPAIQQRIRRYATPGVHQVNINPTNLRRTLIELPTDLSIQQKINEMLTESEQTIDQMRQEAHRLQMLKTGLMEDLLTGRVRVSEAEAVLESL